jgi:hypothetical protein
MVYSAESPTLYLNKNCNYYKHTVEENKEGTVYFSFLSSIVDIFPVERCPENRP